jgi:hypothetical protein
MFEAKNVNLSSWTNYEFFSYPGFNMSGGLSKICIYNRNITTKESELLYYGSNIIKTGLTVFIDPGNIISYEPGLTTSYSLVGTFSATLLNNTSYDNIGAFSFDGVDNYIISNSNLGISGNAEFSICYWAIWDDDNFSGNYPSGVGNNSTGTPNTGLSTTWQNGKVALDFWNNRYVATESLLVRNWYYLCFTKTPGLIGSTSKIYVDGVEVDGTVSGSNSTPNIADSPLVIGRLDSNTYFKGRISNIKIYNRALTESEIKHNFNVTKHRYYPDINTSMDPQAKAFIERMEADGAVISDEVKRDINKTIKRLKSILGTSDIHSRVKSMLIPHWGNKNATGTGQTAGGRACSKIYNLCGAVGDVVQNTATAQPLLLRHTGRNYVWFPGVETGGGNYVGTPNALPTK